MRRMSRATVLLLAALLTFTGVASPTAADTPSPPPSVPPSFRLVDYPTGQAAYNLTNFAWVGDGGLLTSGKDGTVTFVPPGGAPRVLARVPSVRAVGDHGMLGLAPAHDYASTGRVFLTYDKGPVDGGFGMVEEWKAAPPADPTSFTWTRTIVDGSATFPRLTQLSDYHAIDSVEVGLDDTLFVSIGDDAGVRGEATALRAQDLDLPYGKLLHITETGKGVSSNPYYSSASPTSWRSMVYASGFRNPFRFSVDPRSGVIHLGDVGWNTTEEVNTLAPGDNAGWPCYEGAKPLSTYSSDGSCQTLYASGSARQPIATYAHAGAGAAVTGGVLYTGTSYPAQYRNSYFFGDYARGQLWTLASDTAGRLTRPPETNGFATGIGGPVAFRAGPNGDVTYADILTGNVRRLVYAPGNRPPVARVTTTTDAPTRTVSFSASDSYDLDGDPLDYTWDFGDGGTGTGVTVGHTFASAAPVRVTLTVTDSLGATSGPLSLTVYPANHTPRLTLSSPSGRSYAVGDTVSLAATGSDTEDGALTVSWDTALEHCPFAGSCHRHPDAPSAGPTYSRQFTDHGADTTMLVTARVQDSKGATATATYEAVPWVRRVAVVSPVAVLVNGESAASTQVVVGSTVQVRAPTASAYWRFQRWSDGGAATHSFRMLASTPTTLTAQYQTEISARYAAMGGDRSWLGAPTSPEYDVKGGRARNFAGGRLYWSPTSGVHGVRGVILARYLASGGPATLGLPTSDEYGVPGGRAESFARSRIYWSAATGAHVIFGAILAKYLTAGGPAALGLPVSEEIGVPGGRASYLTRARIYWSGRTGAHTLSGPVLTKYLSARGPAGYGLPWTDVVGVRGGSYAHFSYARSIFSSRRHGTHLVYGPIRQRYAAKGYQRSCLGFPRSDQYAVRGGVRNLFAKGVITYSTRTHVAKAKCVRR